MLLLNCKQSQDEASLLLHFLPTARPAAIFKIRAIPEDLDSSHTNISFKNVGAIQGYTWLLMGLAPARGNV